MWLRAIEVVGALPPKGCWVHVGDRSADMWSFFTTCAQQGCDFLVGAAPDRRVQPDAAGVTAAGTDHLFVAVPTLPAWDQRELAVPAQHGQPKRTAQLAIHAGPLTLLPPRQPSGQQPVPLWVMWVHELSAPPEGVKRLDWVLLTSVPTTDAATAWELVAGYRCRWLVEQYHQCLKSGCSLQRRQLRAEARLERLLALLAPMAVYLLPLRDRARSEPQRLAQEALPAYLVPVVAYLAQVPLEHLTLDTFWTTVARQGGYLGRATDPPPGWQVVWTGSKPIPTLLERARLAAHLTLESCG